MGFHSPLIRPAIYWRGSFEGGYLRFPWKVFPALFFFQGGHIWHSESFGDWYPHFDTLIWNLLVIDIHILILWSESFWWLMMPEWDGTKTDHEQDLWKKTKPPGSTRNFILPMNSLILAETCTFENLKGKPCQGKVALFHSHRYLKFFCFTSKIQSLGSTPQPVTVANEGL